MVCNQQRRRPCLVTLWVSYPCLIFSPSYHALVLSYHILSCPCLIFSCLIIPLANLFLSYHALVWFQVGAVDVLVSPESGPTAAFLEVSFSFAFSLRFLWPFFLLTWSFTCSFHLHHCSSRLSRSQWTQPMVAYLRGAELSLPLQIGKFSP